MIAILSDMAKEIMIVVDDSLSFASLYCSCKVGPLVLL